MFSHVLFKPVHEQSGIQSVAKYPVQTDNSINLHSSFQSWRILSFRLTHFPFTFVERKLKPWVKLHYVLRREWQYLFARSANTVCCLYAPVRTISINTKKEQNLLSIFHVGSYLLRRLPLHCILAQLLSCTLLLYHQAFRLANSTRFTLTFISA